MTERERFEQCVMEIGILNRLLLSQKTISGEYDSETAQDYWELWQASRAASPKVPQGVEEWIAENGLQFVDTMGGFAVSLNRSKTCQYPYPEYVSVDDLRAYLSGMAIVPVDDLDAIAEVVRGMLHTAYQNAMPVCCGKPGQQCCGNPYPEWSAEDMEVMDSLGPIEKRISAMLAAAKETK